MNSGKGCKESKVKGCQKEDKIGDFMHIDLCKTEMMLEQAGHRVQCCSSHIIDMHLIYIVSVLQSDGHVIVIVGQFGTKMATL
jgi:hypothetical protein